MVAFTGAGISTDSGIPDFRGPDGVWTRRDAGLAPPRWRVPHGQVKPNASHLALVELQRLSKLKFLITQNTDNLHRQSGIPPELLAELHGNGQLMRCLACGGRLISSVVNFGDPLPEKELMLAAEHARACDLMLVLGSSLVVNPAASLVGLALKQRARVVLVNQGETPYDEVVALRVWEGIGEVLPPAVEMVKRAVMERPRVS